MSKHGEIVLKNIQNISNRQWHSSKVQKTIEDIMINYIFKQIGNIGQSLHDKDWGI